MVQNNSSLNILCRIVDGPAYSVWWQLSDKAPALVRKCETMVKLLCKGSYIKDDDSSIGARMCTHCERG